MNVVMASEDFLPNPGGVAPHVYGLSQALRKAGHRVQVVTHRRQGEDVVDRLDGLKVSRVSGSWRRVRRIDYILREAFLLRRLVREGELEIVHAHCLVPDALATKLVGGCARIVTNHTSGFVMQARARQRLSSLRWRLSHADAVIAPSSEITELTVDIGIPERKVFFVPNGVDVDTFRPDLPCAQVRKEWGLAPHDVVVFAARRLVPKNGVIHLIQAAEIVLREFPEARFVVAGDGPQRAQLERLAGDLKESKRLLFLGNVSREEMPACVAACDIAVLPSLIEATSVAGLEAMAAGKALVGTRVGGIPEIINDGVTGILVDPGDPEALADGICPLLRDPALRQEMGRAARRRAVEEFSWESVASRTLEVYEWAISQCRGRRAG